jgi:hypothetical protein
MPHDEIKQHKDHLIKQGAAVSPLAEQVVQKRIGDIEFELRVSPCSWMYPGHGFQIEVKMIPNGGTTHLRDKGLRFEDAGVADMERLFESVKVVQCSCGKPAFDPTAVETNRAGKCEVCFMTELRKEFDAETAKEAKRRKAMFRRRAKEGYTHVVQAWIHPKAGGSDYQVDIFYLKLPTAAEIKAALKKQGSMQVDDYRVSTIEDALKSEEGA